jgi:hypothetical protein
MRPVFGKPTQVQLTAAQAVVRDHFSKQISAGVFDDWASQLGRAFARPVSKLVAPLAMRRYTTPRERYMPLLALRTRDRGTLTRKGVINLLSFALAIDALFTPTIPAPVRNEYMIALLGQRFMSREVYSRTVMRYRNRREKTGVIRYGPNGPQELTRMVEEEAPVKEYFRIRRADMRYIGRRVWQSFERILIAGGRQGGEWQALQANLRQRLA